VVCGLDNAIGLPVCCVWAIIRSATYVRSQRGTARIRTPLLQQSIDISCQPGPLQQTYSSGFAVGPCLDREVDDRQTDTVPFHRPCSAYYAGSANNLQRMAHAISSGV